MLGALPDIPRHKHQSTSKRLHLQTDISAAGNVKITAAREEDLGCKKNAVLTTRNPSRDEAAANKLCSHQTTVVTNKPSHTVNRGTPSHGKPNMRLTNPRTTNRPKDERSSSTNLHADAQPNQGKGEGGETGHPNRRRS